MTESSIIMQCVFLLQRDHPEELQRWTLIYEWFKRWFSTSINRSAHLDVQMGTTMIWLYQPQQSLAVDFFPVLTMQVLQQPPF